MEKLIIPATDLKVEQNVRHILGTLKEKYGFKADIDDLPPILQNPAPKRTKYLVFVVSKILPQHIVEVEEIQNYLDLSKAMCLEKVIFLLPPRNELGYFVWMSDGSLYIRKAPGNAEEFLGKNERQGIMSEGLHLWTQYGEREGLLNPEQGKPHMDFPGSRCGLGNAPCLHRWLGGLLLDASRPGVVVSRFGSVSCGSAP